MVAQAVMDKPHMEKVNLNGTSAHQYTALPVALPHGNILDTTYVFICMIMKLLNLCGTRQVNMNKGQNCILTGNCLGEDGCDVLREVLDNVDKGDLLASLR